MDMGRSVLGIFVLLALAYAISDNRQLISPRTVLAALATQIGIGALVLFVPVGRAVLSGAAIGVNHVIEYGNAGIGFVFGGLVHDHMMELFGGDGFVFGLRVLPMIIFMTALISVLYHLGVMRWVVLGLGTVSISCSTSPSWRASAR